MQAPAQPRRTWPFWLTVLVAAGVFLYLIKGVLLPFIAGFIIAYFLDPVVKRLERLGLSRVTVILLVSLGLALLGAALALLVVPLVVNQATQLLADLPSYVEAVKQWSQRILTYVTNTTGIDVLDRLQEDGGEVGQDAVGAITDILNSLISGGLALANLVSLVLITPIVTVFLLANWDRIVRAVDDLLPRPHLGTLRQLLGEMDRVLAGFLRGQGLVCLIMAAYYALALSLGGLRYGVLVGLLAGLLTFIPFVGALTGLVLTLVLAFVQFDTLGPVIVLLGLYFAGQIVEGNVLTPRIVGRQIGLHDLWLIFAVLVGGALFGPFGVLLAVPVTGCLGVLVRHAVRRYKASAYYRGEGGPL